MRKPAVFGLHILAGLSALTLADSATQPHQSIQYPLQALKDDSQLNCGSCESFLTLTRPEKNARVHRVAIVGAGPAGSSAAYHLRQFSTSPLNITIFDSNPYIGGRTTTVNALNDPRYPVELGASIFVDINAILFNATRDFELPVDNRIYESTGAKYELGIWDGTGFVFYAAASEDDDGSGGSGGSWLGKLAGWWDIAKLFWRYGLSPLRLRTLQQNIIGRFLRMYIEDDGFPFPDLTAVAADIDLLSVTGKSGSALLKEAGISEPFAREIVQASSRVNYAQNLDDFQGLETMVCMSTEGAMSVQGGNWQIFDHMVKHSGAEIRLNTTVTNIHTTEDGISLVNFKTNKPSSITENNDNEDLNTQLSHAHSFDTVILAHPHNPAELTINPSPNPPLETPDYISLHVTLFTTPSRPHPHFFNLNLNSNDPSTSSIPDTILTTLPRTLSDHPLGRGPAALGLTPFWSLSTLRVLNPATDTTASIPDYLTSGTIPPETLSLNQTQYLYKIFSPEPLPARFFVDLFQWDLDLPINIDVSSDRSEIADLAVLPKELLTWYHEKTWDSYPYLPPRDTFEGFDVYAMDEKRKGKVWRTAPMEVFISTMETMALSGRNVARLVVDRLEEGKGQAE